jgi:hypothetical protein
MTVVSDVAGDHDLKSEESTAGDFGAPHCFVLLLVLVLGAFQYSYPAYWSASSREPLRTTIGIAAVRTAIEYEYRFTEYRFAEYEYDEIRGEARTHAL